MSTINVTNLAGPSNTGTAATLSSINGGPISGARNRIINGDMRIDQRNAGASVTPNPDAYTLDRWYCAELTDGAVSVQRVADGPAGFTNSLRITVSTADSSLAAGQITQLSQFLEGLNVDDLAFGTASAKAVVISFWVKSSVTGTFSGSLANGAANRSYPFTYSISAANTWEYKTVSIAGDTTGTWPTDNSKSFALNFSLGSGTTFSGTAGAWAASDFRAATGGTNLMATLNATWQITGVQLEAGTVATPFERRSYGQELALCQRYFEKSYDVDVAPGTVTTNGLHYVYGTADGAGSIGYHVRFATVKRSNPTMTYYSTTSGAGFWNWDRSGTSSSGSVTNGGVSGTTSNLIYVSVGVTWTPTSARGHWTASAEL